MAQGYCEALREVGFGTQRHGGTYPKDKENSQGVFGSLDLCNKKMVGFFVAILNY